MSVKVGTYGDCIFLRLYTSSNQIRRTSIPTVYAMSIKAITTKLKIVMSDLLAIPVAPEVLFRPRLSLDDGIDGFQMRRIGDDGDFNVFVRHSIKSFRRCAQVVFHIAATFDTRSENEINIFFNEGCNRFHVRNPSSTVDIRRPTHPDPYPFPHLLHRVPASSRTGTKVFRAAF